MYSVIKVALLCALPSLGLAHGQSPGFESEVALTQTFSKSYELRNSYDFPITLQVEVFEKDGTPAEGWSTNKSTFKMKPNAKKRVDVTFDVQQQRKVLVCSRLIGVGYEQKEPHIVSRVCSRLIINGVSR